MADAEKMDTKAPKEEQKGEKKKAPWHEDREEEDEDEECV